MSYPEPDADAIAFFQQHGYLVVRDAVPQADLDELEARMDTIVEDPTKMKAFDWAWSADESREDRSFKIIQAIPERAWPEIDRARFRAWAVEFGSALLGKRVEFWYGQFLAKPPGRSVPTYWHQDEGYWGRNLDDKGITCWFPLQDVDERNGCMHFVDGGHRDGVLEHTLVEGVQSDLLTCQHQVDAARAVACPIRRGDVTFHHSATPHMTTANTGTSYRKALTQHMQTPDAGGEGDHYPWKIWVDQRDGQSYVPEDFGQVRR
ncbi:MAG TPA: phytanoyl-CoA dioxygenase family protein [Acidimicrobiales bacterium]|nr:phytanoyl-CoA dioxygenase family protein [Acidimicrobiales bacterium]